MRITASIAVLLCAISPASAQSGKKSAGGATEAPVEVCGKVDFVDGEMTCSCEAGVPTASVWGSGPYTADSNICTAAVHSGAITEDGGVVRLLELPGLDDYTGSTAYGVTTNNWGSYGKSFDVVSVSASASEETASDLPVCATIPSDVEQYACHCPADNFTGSVWGNDPYTADSQICAAARHSDYIDEKGGDVFVLAITGLESYFGSENHGVTSNDWGSYSKSIIFDRNR